MDTRELQITDWHSRDGEGDILLEVGGEGTHCPELCRSVEGEKNVRINSGLCICQAPGLGVVDYAGSRESGREGGLLLLCPPPLATTLPDSCPPTCC